MSTPILSEFSARSTPSNSQREASVRNQVRPRDNTDDAVGSTRGSRRRRIGNTSVGVTEVGLSGVESLSDAIRPASKEAAIAREEAERDKAIAEAASAKSSSLSAALSTIRILQEIIEIYTKEEVRKFYEELLEKEIATIRQSAHSRDR